jgi:Uma2 family endonuclease
MHGQVPTRRFTVEEFQRMAEAGILGEDDRVELADTSLRYDRDLKLPRYAASGIPEAWLIDVEGERIEVHRDPGAEGYARVRTVTRGAEIEVAGLPGVTLTADEILG